MRRSLAIQTAVYASMLSTAVCLVVSLLLFQSHRNTQEERHLERTAETLSQLWTFRELTPQGAGSWERWQGLMNQTPDVLYTYLVDRTGKIELGIQGKLSADVDAAKQPWEPEPLAATKNEPRTVSFSANRRAEEALAGRVKSGDPLALISLAVDCGVGGCRELRAVVRLQSVSKALRSLRRSLLLAVLAICLGTGSFVFLITRHQLRPVEDLAEEVLALPQGDVLSPEALAIGAREGAPWEIAFLKEAVGRYLRSFQRASVLEQELRLKKSVSELTAQIAHDLRSPLAALELGTESSAAPSAERDSLVRGAVARLKEIIRGLVPPDPSLKSLPIPRVEIPASGEVIVVDDDDCVHMLWKKRFEGKVQVTHFSKLSDFRAWGRMGEKDRLLFLVDHEFKGESITGLQTIVEFGLQERAILVTSRFEEPALREECAAQRIRLLPKTEIPKVEVVFPRAGIPQAILIDDDPLVCAGWSLSAKKRGKRLLAFRSGEEFRKQMREIPREVPLFIDSNLGETEKGEALAEEFHKQAGFSSVYLVTGYSANQFEPMPWLKGILDKTPPEWLF